MEHSRRIPTPTRLYMNRDAMKARDWVFVVATVVAIVAWTWAIGAIL